MDSHEETVPDKSLTVDTGDLTMGANASHEVHAFYDNKDVTDKVNWSSDNNKITVNNGLITTSATAQVGDVATITASTDDTSTLVAALDKLGLITVASAEDGSDSVSFTVTVVDINFDDTDGNEIDNVSILPGENKSIRAKIVPETTGTVVWSCTAPSGITLQKNGNDVTIYVANDMPEGRTYNIVAIYGDYAKTITLNIASTAKDNLSVSIEDGDTLTIGDVKTVNVITTDNTTPSNVTITSSDENVAKIVDGKIEAVNAGEATITISADGSVAKTINILVEQVQMLEAGLYDANDNLIVTWDNMVSETGFDISTDYTSSTYSQSAFYHVTEKYSTVKKVVVPEGIKKIGNRTFYNCASLTSIEIPDSVISIGDYAFYKCTSLKSIEILDSVTSIGNYAFFRCASLTSIKMPSVTSVGERVFENCTSLTTIEMPSITSIGNQVFQDCASLTSIEIPDSVTSIGIAAFRRCTSLTSIEIPDSVTTIEDGAFDNCTLLESIEIPPSVTSINSNVFNSCSSLKSIEIPDSVTSIGINTFYGCTSLKSIEIPSSVTKLGMGAFDKCTSLKSIIYNGTKEQWKAISKGNNWNYGMSNYVIYCTDGIY